ncbi:MAG: hypothetical protein U5M53_12260 [Rhodoferax sp.]|nr:hypothetical protein [Rhodoferax sp.]
MRLLPGLSLYLASTRSEAQDLFEEAHAHLGRAQRLAKLGGILGITIDGLPTDRPLGPRGLSRCTAAVRSRTHADLLRQRITSERPTLDALLTLPEVVSSAHWQVIGTPADAVEQVLSWQKAEAIDGSYRLARTAAWGHSDQFLDVMLPKPKRQVS